MRKIEISDIRIKSSSLVELNEGYKLYQNKEITDVELSNDSTGMYEFIVTGYYNDKKINLYVSDMDVHGNCDCHLGGLCRHEVALYFNLKDIVYNIMNDKNELLRYESTKEIDKLLNGVYNSLVIPSVNNLEIYPVLDIEDNQIKLFLDVVIDNKRKKVKNMKAFMDSIRCNLEYTFDMESIPLSRSVLSKRSNQLINLISSFEFGKNNIIIDLNVFDDIYNLYNDTINVYNGYYIKEYEFTNDKFILDMDIADNKLSIKDTSYILLKSINNDYIIYKEKIYVINNHTLYMLLAHMKNNKGEILFNKDSYNSFLINVYPYVKDYINGVDYCYDISISSYIDYKDKKLTISHKSDIEDNLMFVSRTNYLRLLNKLGFNKENGYTLTKYDDICNFVKYQKDSLLEYGPVYLSDSVNKLDIKAMKQVKFNLTIDGGIVRFIYDNLAYSINDLNKILLSYKNGNKYVELNEGTVEIDPNEVNDLSNIMSELSIDNLSEANIKLYQAYYINSKYRNYFNISDDFNKFLNDLSNYNDTESNIKDSIKDVMRDYQMAGFKWLKVLSNYNMGGILADDMGLGKTLQVIALLDSMPKNKPSLIVSPTSLIFNWSAEIKKFAPHLQHIVMYGKNREEANVKKALANNDIIIISYETLRIDIDMYKDTEFNFCVVDEAQYIKNPNALKTIAVKSIRSNMRFALTGTPIENSLMDLWSIFDFVLPGYLEAKNKFISRYEAYTSNSDILDDLSKRIMPFMLRRLKTDVLDLEEKIETYSYSVMSNEEDKLYRSYLSDAVLELKTNNYKITSVLSVLTRLRQLACEPRLFLDNVKTKNSKMDLMMEIVDEKIQDDHKILIFSQFTSIFEHMEKRLNDKGIKYLTLTGQTKPIDRATMVEEFNKDNDIKVFLISLKAGGTGLNLTAADTVIHYDPWWNNAAMNQATDRAYRIGQEKMVHVIKLINKDTIEEKILDLQNQKKFLFDSVIAEDDVIKKIDLSDLKELFN